MASADESTWTVSADRAVSGKYIAASTLRTIPNNAIASKTSSSVVAELAMGARWLILLGDVLAVWRVVIARLLLGAAAGLHAATLATCDEPGPES
jgi:hypothetical protein